MAGRASELPCSTLIARLCSGRVRRENLPRVIAKCDMVCWNCHITETFLARIIRNW